MADVDDAASGSPLPTRRDIRRAVVFTSAEERRFASGDRLNLLPPLPRGSTWTVVARAPSETEGIDETLVVEPAGQDPLAEGR